VFHRGIRQLPGTSRTDRSAFITECQKLHGRKSSAAYGRLEADFIRLEGFFVRKIATIVATTALLAAVAAALTGCTSSSAVAGCATTKSGSVSDGITVSGNFGKTPTVKLKSPIATVKTTQRTVVKSGSGAVAAKNKSVTADFVIYNGTTGKELTSTGFDGKTVPFTMDTAKYLPGLVKTLECSRVGTRVVGVIPPADAFKSTGSTDLGVGAKDEMVFVADVVSVKAAAPAALKTATGTKVAPKAGFPTVVFAKGLPTVTIPATAQPSAYEEELLIKGKGAKVGSDANVVVNYQLVLWRTGKVVSGNDTYSSGQSATFNTGQVVAGFKKALEGQTVGSRVLVVIPPALGYGTTGSPTAGITATDDLVFVVDILGIS
jgi:peptidylprolyl isomerase